MRPLSASERRLVAVALLLVALALAWALIIAPLQAGFSARALERETLLQNYQRNERVIASMRGFRAALRAQRRDGGLYAIAAPSAAEAAEALRSHVLTAARAAGVASASAAETPGPEGTVAVRADMQLNLAQMETMFRALQNGRPPLFITSMDVSSERSGASGRPDLLDLRLELQAPHVLAPAV